MSRFPTLLPLRYFRAVVRAGSPTAAARELTVARSTLGAALSPVGVLHGLGSTVVSTWVGGRRVWADRG